MLTYKKPLFILLLTLLLIGIVRQITFQKDLTADNRYSLSDTSILKLKALDEPVRIDIFLNGKY